MSISKQGYLQQRKKLNYEVFSFLNTEYLKDFYCSTEPVLWNNYLVFAIDGSKAEVPNSDENREFFCECGNNHSKGEVRALVSGIFDVFNHFFLNLQIDSIKTSESELAKKNIQSIRKILPNTEFIVVFDRGYPSIELIHFLEKNGVQYLFRLSSNDYKKERNLMITGDEAVKLMADIINNLYNLALFLLGGCVVILLATVGYAVGIIKYSKKYMLLTEELEKIKIDNMVNKENI